jgi:DNA-binding transcriptional ArsR family regulator
MRPAVFVRQHPVDGLPALLPPHGVDLLALLYLHPEDEYSLSEAATAIGASLNTVHYETNKLFKGCLIRSRKRGNLRLIRAVTDSLLSRPLTDLPAVTAPPATCDGARPRPSRCLAATMND